MSRYQPGKRAHRVLQHLEHQAETFSGLVALFASEARPNMRLKLHSIANALRDDGFVDRCAGAYRITDSGRAALLTLDRGETVVTSGPSPSARFFGVAA